jgi:hypothetical protein
MEDTKGVKDNTMAKRKKNRRKKNRRKKNALQNIHIKLKIE